MIGKQQVANLAVALRERATDMFRSPVSTASIDQQSGTTEIQIQGYQSELPFNPELYKRWYKRLAQDVLDESGSPVLRTTFEYAGVIIGNARILSDGVTHVSVFDADNQIQEEYSTHHRLKPSAELKRKPTQRISGSTLHLCAPLATVQGNFAHWLLDGLARWILLEDRAEAKTNIDQFLIPANKPAFRESLQVLGVSNDRIIEMPIRKAMEFEQLVCISRPRGYSSNVAPGWLIDGYRNRLESSMVPANQANKKLYISRKDAGARKFRQEDDLVAALEKRGFESVELSKLGFRQKADLFSKANNVVGLTGAGMMSVMFCPPGARVIELYPSNFVSYLFATVSAALGHQHHDYIFKNTSKRSLLSRHSGEFDLDLSDFLAALDAWSDA